MLKLFGKQRLNFDDYKTTCIEIFKNEVIKTADDYQAASTQYLGKDIQKQKILNARGPESIYMLTIHVMCNILDYQIRVAEGRRAADSVIQSLLKWVLFAGSFELPPKIINKETIKKLKPDTTDRSAKYHNEVLNKNGQLKQVPATISSLDYLEQKAIPCFKIELARQFGIADIDELDPAFINELIAPLYRLHTIFDKFLQKNKIKHRH